MNLNVYVTPLVFVLTASACTAQTPTPPSKVTSYEECVSQGYPVLRSLPPKCIAEGRTFVKGRIGRDEDVPSPSKERSQ